MQQSKITWLKLGDSNNSYFHTLVKEKNKQKGVHTITSLQGETLYQHKDIEREVLSFYTNLICTNASELKGIDIAAARRGTTISVEKALRLIRPVDEGEIWNALNSIGNCKAPGIDGFNAHFFKTTWSVIKQDVISAILEFFSTSRMLRAVNCSLITSISKSDATTIIKDL
ncbi:unnamed protein product [Lathyrus sativus]|nr:unnamed protein product [Lathyrus sativus]